MKEYSILSWATTIVFTSYRFVAFWPNIYSDFSKLVERVEDWKLKRETDLCCQEKKAQIFSYNKTI